MRIWRRIKKEIWTYRYRAAGYSRRTASRWYKAVRRDNRLFRNKYSKKELQDVHKRGYLAKNIERYGLFENPNCSIITDLDYLSLRPLNNNFSKWIEDMYTMRRRLPDYKDNFAAIYFSILPREATLVLNFAEPERKSSVENIVDFLKEYDGVCELRPAFWNSKGRRYKLEYKKGNLYVNDTLHEEENLIDIINGLKKGAILYLITEKPVFNRLFHEGQEKDFYIKVYVANGCSGTSNCRILCALISVMNDCEDKTERHYIIDTETGAFEFEGKKITIPKWKGVSCRIYAIGKELIQLSFFSISFVLTENGFKIINCNQTPFLPRTLFVGELNDYLKYRLKLNKADKQTPKAKRLAIKKSLYAKYVRKFCRPGMRPYMQRLWESSVLSDLKYHGTTFREKIWAWKRGFLSFRIKQYKLTEDNYRNMLSDYDYCWLNRINNAYQSCINDKTTFRYTMNNFKDFIPKYYFSIFKRDGRIEYTKMPDCPQGIEPSNKGVLKLLRLKGKLVFKPSAGTHGDGFYCLEHHKGVYFINGRGKSADDVLKTIGGQKSFYVITDYIIMHHELKEIYPKSVNSMRIMVINEDGRNPRIMQTYLRIGSSKTGYTDNVGYGGICAMIDKNGYLYDPEQLVDHEYCPCPRHPDTKTEIAGRRIPNWDLILNGVIRICKSMPELEYLGFDVAVTEKGFNVMEINIHQDLHKVALHPAELRDFYKRKIEFKKSIYSI